jgi:hypothetical protein
MESKMKAYKALIKKMKEEKKDWVQPKRKIKRNWKV